MQRDIRKTTARRPSLERERGARWRARGALAAVGAWRPLLASLLSSSPDAAASLRRALRARGVVQTGEEGGEESDAACSQQWGESLFAFAAAGCNFTR